MSNNRLIISSAGSGKTTYLVNESLKIKDSKVLITTYTEANEEEIRKKIIEINGFIPYNIIIQTWFSFLLEHGVKPFQSHLFNDKVEGLILVNTQSALKFIGKFPVYYGEEDIKRHYFSPSNLIYSDKLSKFVFKCNARGNGDVIDRLSKIYKYIFIDEVQDLAGYDLDLIKLFFKSPIHVLLVGDPRQVTYLTHNEKRLSKYTHGLIKEFILKECKKEHCVIDEAILNCSHRNNQLICDFSSQLYPELEASKSGHNITTDHDGLFLLKTKDIQKYLQKFNPIQLRYSVSTQTELGYKVKNYGESKGLTFDRVLIYPTKPIIQYLKDGITTTEKKKGENQKIKASFIPKFYVAITRAKYSVAIVLDYTEENYIEGINKFSFD
jgi:DNA helicase-2/ATP-dependent DNA helicase PcrA